MRVLLVALLVLLARPAAAEGLRQALPGYLPSIGLVLTGSGSGTAFAIECTRDSTLFVTSSHVVEGARSVRVVLGEAEPREATVVADDPRSDLALLEVRGLALAPLPLSEREPDLGADIAVVGFPLADRMQDAGLGLQASLSKGVLSAVRQSPHGQLLQVDVPINPGNSGGPAFDWDTGRVVGVAMGRLRDATDINFLVGIGSLRRFLSERPSPIEPVAAGSIAEALGSLELRYKIDEDGDYRLLFELEEGRSQLVYINGEPEEYGGIRIREIWAPSFRSPGPLSADLANQLLVESQNAKIGAWQAMDLGDERIVTYAVKVRDDLEPQELQEWLDIVMFMADRMERQVTGQDEF